MSALQKTIMKNKLPPRVPRTSGVSKMAPFGAGRRKDYTPVSWKQYFHQSVDVTISAGTFRVYLSPEPDHPDRPRIVTLHGGGYSGLSWSLFTEEITSMVHCQVVSIDIRGHGETKVENCDDLSIETLVNDIEQVLHKLFNEGIPPLILVGHSMGGAVAVRVALQPSLEHCIQGIAVIDVVEGTAMDALASMQSFLRSRPTHFKMCEVVKYEMWIRRECQCPVRLSSEYKWRIELSRTERHWSGWFRGLSAAFLAVRAPRLLLLASIDGLDRELTVGQMQGSYLYTLV
ncbi:hypothetical protein SFRURICE_014110 [Spodoptera frugiperda]|nr:hypothetical protein SFRURICE_014110 [Spodoptera frugiperda]